MALCVVSGRLIDSKGDPVTNAEITARLTSPIVEGTDLIVPTEQSVSTNASGQFTLTLHTSATFVCLVQYPPNAEDSQRLLSYALQTTAATSADFTSIIMNQ